MTYVAFAQISNCEPEAALAAFYNAPAVVRERVLRGEPEEDLRFTGGLAEIPTRKESAYESYEYAEQRDLTPAEARRIYDALCRDIALGHADGSLFEAQAATGTRLGLYASYPVEGLPQGEREQVEFYPAVTERMTETLAALKEMGIEAAFS